MAKSGRDGMTSSARTVRNVAATAAAGKPHQGTFGNAAPKPLAYPRAGRTHGSATVQPTKQTFGHPGAQRGGSK